MSETIHHKHKNHEATGQDAYECGHSHKQDAKLPHNDDALPKGITRKKYEIKNLDCPNCGAKIERLIGSMDGIYDANLSFSTMRLSIAAKNPDKMLPEIIKTARTIEDGFELEEIKDTAHKIEPAKLDRTELLTLIIGVALYAVSIICGHALPDAYRGTVTVVISAAAYLILGGGVLWTAAKNIAHGKIFDENFLMSIATLGAFFIGEYTEAVGVMLFFRIGELFEDIAVSRSRSKIMQAVDLRPETVNLIKGEKVSQIRAEDAAVGDVILIRPGERIPLDGTIVNGESCLDTSAITGEPLQIIVSAGDSVVSGFVNTTSPIKLRVETELKGSMVTRILDSVENAAASKPKIENFITRFARVYTPIVVVIALFTAFIIPLFTERSLSDQLYTAISFLVMSCPCALVLSVPLAYFCGIGAGSKYGILFKGGISLEALSSIKAVVMDKTGTITEGKFIVRDIHCADGYTETAVLQLCGSLEAISTHPIAQSVVGECRTREIALNRLEYAKEIAGRGIEAEIDGKSVLAGNMSLMHENGVDMSLYPQSGGKSEVILAVDKKYAGRIEIYDKIKDGAAYAVQCLKSHGIKTAMLTGDSEKSAQNTAEEIGIDEVHAKLLPTDKLDCLREIREKNGSVMFVGDGINDAPVLAGADVGAAMGSGADAAIEAADVVFMNSNPDAIERSIVISRSVTKIARQNVVFAIAIKAIVMVLGLLGIYSNIWLAVFADTGVAFLCILNSIRALYK